MTESQALVDTIEPTEVSRLLHAHAIMLVDVREPAEFAAERIAGAVLFPLSTFDATMLPDDESRRIVFHCGSGKRSLTAAEHRLSGGQKRVAHMRGGLAGWKAAGLPIVSPAKHNLREILHVHDCDVTDSHFANTNLTGCRFQNVNLSRSRFTDVDCSHVVFEDANFNDASIANVNLRGMTIDGVMVSDLFKAYEAWTGRS